MENNTEKVIKDLQNEISAMLFLFSMQEEVNDIAMVAEYMANITNPTVTELTTYSKALKRFHRDLKPIIKKIKGE